MNEPYGNKPSGNKASDNEDFTAQAKGAFDDSVERLDAAALSRLNQGRHAALEQLASGSSKAAWMRWAPAGGVAAAALITMIVMRGPEMESMPVEVVSDFEILLEDESLQMLEDLEFYSWLDDVELDASGNVG
jgi:hypothetical protein